MGDLLMNLFDQHEIESILEDARNICHRIQMLDDSSKIEALNHVRLQLHEVSPFRDEPVDCVQWVKGDDVQANDYNPNSVAPPEMKLLEHSILQDGYTQPIVTWSADGHREVIDGFHRNRVGKESKTVSKRIKGYLPVVTINQNREDRNDRMASTIRHNRARGKHRVDSMSEIVVELKRRCWTDERIASELGMEPDEVLRLTQISGIQGLAEMFAAKDFTEAWEVEWTEDTTCTAEAPGTPESLSAKDAEIVASS